MHAAAVLVNTVTAAARYPQPSTLYISEVAKADDKGNLKIVDTRAVPDAQVRPYRALAGSPPPSAACKMSFRLDCVVSVLLLCS